MGSIVNLNSTSNLDVTRKTIHIIHEKNIMGWREYFR